MIAPSLADMKQMLKEFDEICEKNFETMNKKRKMMKAIMLKEHGADFDKVKRTMEINVAEMAVIDEWRESLEGEVIYITGDEYAYPSITYCFTATGLGYVLTVKESITEKELNVSDALHWYFYG